mmetsp:Transcript_12886/g.24540  ORF Transcript_12886/g.24540 Transcript_12886/m.24540 type:complete len:385 (+) Transcript_12886:104-1258(+)
MTLTNEYEEQRVQRIAENNARLAALGIKKQTSLMESVFRACKPNKLASCSKASRPIKASSPIALRSPSLRLQGKRAPEAAHADLDALLDDTREGKCARILLNKNVEPDAEEQDRFQQMMKIRCNSKGRGSVYDSSVGICCHFCRQKKLCGEAHCGRCQSRDPALVCAGKTECTRCHSQRGRFCRACLLVRYGQQLEHALADPNWLCPHCYEEDFPESNWICNSSICMTRRKMRPTGIAIFEAQARGFPSVAHWLQAQLAQRKSACAPPKEESVSTVACLATRPSEAKNASDVQPATVALLSSSSSSHETLSASSGDDGNATRASKRLRVSKHAHHTVDEGSLTNNAMHKSDGMESAETKDVSGASPGSCTEAGRVLRSRNRQSK